MDECKYDEHDWITEVHSCNKCFAIKGTEEILEPFRERIKQLEGGLQQILNITEDEDTPFTVFGRFIGILRKIAKEALSKED